MGGCQNKLLTNEITLGLFLNVKEYGIQCAINFLQRVLGQVYCISYKFVQSNGDNLNSALLNRPLHSGVETSDDNSLFRQALVNWLKLCLRNTLTKILTLGINLEIYCSI